MYLKVFKFEQTSPSHTWEINNIPEGAVDPVITHIETNGGFIIQPEHQIKAPYGLQLSFGVESFAGVAYGTYIVESIDNGDDNIVIDGGGVVNITINNAGDTQE